ncbi:hypothetical protein K466DRAFT_514748 [Polyporus arcularius HHB13444]|uniref:F-box domain-containing protein n=1 Tax=Polyporus arcularius HHB13444 TaxID=1314778 RepID=A0A5C3Q052_9APHY|nr:hypothetical protein K466DRAFT_514748 [Polyporus arcularius HHB13444]
MPPRKNRKTANARGKVQADRSGATDARKVKAGTSKRRKVRGKCGRLADMPKMPLDILVEIFSLLHPRDLVNLARTSRDFRTFLMSRDSAPFWRAARKQVDGLPDCPPFLSEPAYANLVFFTHCHGCARPNGSNVVVWSFAVRYCAKCKGDQLVETSSVEDLVSQIQEQRHGCLLVTTSLPLPKSRWHRGHYYHRPEFDRIRQLWEGGFSSDTERDHFYESARQVVQSRLEFGAAIRRWVGDQDARKSAELSLLRDGRIQEVEQRLRDEGWGKDLDWHDGAALGIIKAMKSVCRPHKLTDRAWSTIRKDATQVLEKHRDYRLCEERVNELQPRFTLLFGVVALWLKAHDPPWTAETDWYPSFADFALMSAFRDSIDVPAETEFQDDALLKMQSHIPDLVNTWREECKAAILKIITDGLGSLPNSADPLSLAVATLDCVFCSYKGLRWPQVLAHRCLRGRRNLDPDAAAKNPYRQAVLIARDRLETWYMWDSEAFVFNPSLKRTRAVIEACGKDPDTATYEEMERCGLRVFCSDCLRHCEALDWKMAVRHQTGCSASFKLLNAEDTAKALELEAFQWSQPANAPLRDANTVYGCRHCHYRATGKYINWHSAMEHFIEDVTIDAKFDVDYYVHTDNEPYMPTPIRIYSQGRRQASKLATNAAVEEKAAFVSSCI